MQRTFWFVSLLSLFLSLSAAGCSDSPHELGIALGQEHAAQLRAGRLTVARLVEDLQRAEQRHTDPDDRDAFKRGYDEAIAPVRLELTQLLVSEATGELFDQMGAVAGGLFDAAKKQMKKVEGVDREKLRDLGRDLGGLMKEVGESAEEFGRGVEEGLDSK